MNAEMKAADGYHQNPAIQDQTHFAEKKCINESMLNNQSLDTDLAWSKGQDQKVTDGLPDSQKSSRSLLSKEVKLNDQEALPIKQRRNIHQKLSQIVAPMNVDPNCHSPFVVRSRFSKSLSQESADKELSVYSSKARESLAKQHSILDLVFHESLATKYRQRNSNKNQSQIQGKNVVMISAQS